MPKSQKNLPSSQPSAPRTNWLPLLVAGSVGFFAALALLKGFPRAQMAGCPAFAPACPVLSTMENLETCLADENLDSARQCGTKLTALLQPSIPELVPAAQAIADAKTLPEARRSFASFCKQVESGTLQPPSS
jgi:hypothetical protein